MLEDVLFISSMRPRLIPSIPRIPSMKAGLISRIRFLIPSILLACTAPSDSTADSAAPAMQPPPAPPPKAAAVVLVDTTIPRAVAGQGGWNYQQSSSADLDGDGIVEKVVLTAQVEMMRGRPLWDDGQRWQAYVEEPDGNRTYIFAQFIQLGTLSLRLSAAEGEQRPAIVLLEQLPDRLSVYEIEYLGPGRARSTEPYQRDLDPRGDVASPALP